MIKIEKLKVAAYARVSTDTKDQINSLESQKKYFKEYIMNNKNWKLSNIYYDEGISGTHTKKRDGFNKMIEDAINGKIDLILTKEVSRFARNTVDTLVYTRKLKDHGVEILFTIDNIDTRQQDGELRLTIMASIAQEESRKTSERVKWGQKRKMEEGIVFGRSLLGYKVEKGKLNIDKEESEIVKLIFHKYTNEKKGTHVIAKELIQEKINTKENRNWTNTVILKILKNEKYVGDLCQKKTITPNYLTHEKKYNKGEEKMIYIKNHHEPIIDRTLWERTKKELEERKKQKENNQKYSNCYWASGKIKCSICNKNYILKTKKLKNQIYKTWGCIEKSKHGKQKKDQNNNIIGCDNISVNDKSLNYCMNYILELLNINKEELIKEIINEIENIKEINKEKQLKKIKKEIENIKQKKQKTIDLKLENLITKKELKDQINIYNKEIIKLNKEYQKIKKELTKNTPENMKKTFNIDETIYREILDHIKVYKDKIIDIWLKDTNIGIRLKIETSGKQNNYKTKVINHLFISDKKSILE